MEVHIACVHVGAKYSNEYVENLHQALLRWVPPWAVWDFTVITDHNWCQDRRLSAPVDICKGYWNKLALFIPDAFPAGERVLYFDLDVLVRGDIGPLIARSFRPDVQMFMMQDPIYPERLNSSVMMWVAGQYDEIWTAWNNLGRPTEARLPNTKGDQAWIESVLSEKRPDVWPDHLVKGYYSPTQWGEPWQELQEPGDTPVVVFHGHPHFHERPTTHWARREWDQHAAVS